jgi:hypothetical protein
MRSNCVVCGTVGIFPSEYFMCPKCSNEEAMASAQKLADAIWRESENNPCGVFVVPAHSCDGK